MTFRPDPVALDRVLRGPDGPVARDIQRRTRNVQLKAKDLAPKRSRELERNILSRVGIDARGVLGRVIAGEQLPDARAVWAEYGTREHEIRPVSKKALSFVVNGRRVTVKKVMHPGTKATHFMTRALDEARR